MAERFAISNRAGRALTTFAPNGLERREVFCFSSQSWYVFYSRTQAQGFINMMRRRSLDQRRRWGEERYNKAVELINTLRVVPLD